MVIWDRGVYCVDVHPFYEENPGMQTTGRAANHQFTMEVDYQVNFRPEDWRYSGFLDMFLQESAGCLTMEESYES